MAIEDPEESKVFFFKPEPYHLMGTLNRMIVEVDRPPTVFDELSEPLGPDAYFLSRGAVECGGEEEGGGVSEGD